MVDIDIRQMGGQCPVQAEGTVDGHPFYFRARGEAWSLSIAGPSGDVFGDDAWYYDEDYPGGEYAAGWMTYPEAEGFLRKAAEKYHAEKASEPRP